MSVPYAPYQAEAYGPSYPTAPQQAPQHAQARGWALRVCEDVYAVENFTLIGEFAGIRP